MQDRIKYVRTHANMSQGEFAATLDLSQNYMTMLENGKRNPSERTLNDICEKFNVNPVWLRNGEGEPFVELTADEKVQQVLGDVLKDPSATKNRLIAALAELVRQENVIAIEIIEDFLIEYANYLQQLRRRGER